MDTRKLWRWLLLLCWALAGCAAGQDGLVPIPPLNSPVTDVAGVLDATQIQRLEADLRAFEQRKGSQIAVLIVPTTRPEAIEQYAMRVAEQWKLGRNKIDDGAILVVAKNDRSLRIEVGYGLEGALNDATAKRIIDEIIVPRFRRNDFNGGIVAGVDKIISIADGESFPAYDGDRRRDKDSPMRQLLPLVLIMAVALGAVSRAVFGRVAGSVVAGGVVGGAAWLLAGSAAAAMAAASLAFAVTLIGVSRMAGLYLGRDDGQRGARWGGGGGGFGGGGASGRW
ncbi:TPM domain-containing protein [Pseudoduganella aquatica]|uniref:YgcG family protein n=1 Tax=Pseudoduganella aquatica TaxID=2660641 RepID=A0A7X4HDW0_9BURK|nr:TPM domain-containing protein [Pseudoduganella aquatica]MYN08597.1 YgcG family protein [Pseudoduganella aquatica]